MNTTTHVREPRNSPRNSAPNRETPAKLPLPARQKREISTKRILALLREGHKPSSIVRILQVPKDRVYRRIGPLKRENLLLSSREGTGPKSWVVNPLAQEKPGTIQSAFIPSPKEIHHIKLSCEYSGAQPSFPRQKEDGIRFLSWPCGRSKLYRVFCWREPAYSVAAYPNSTLVIFLEPLKGIPAAQLEPRAYEQATRVMLEFERKQEISIIPGTLRLLQKPHVVAQPAVQQALRPLVGTEVVGTRITQDNTPDKDTVEMEGLELQKALENLPDTLKRIRELKIDTDTLRVQMAQLALGIKELREASANQAFAISSIKTIFEEKKK